MNSTLATDIDSLVENQNSIAHLESKTTDMVENSQHFKKQADQLKKEVKKKNRRILCCFCPCLFPICWPC